MRREERKKRNAKSVAIGELWSWWCAVTRVSLFIVLRIKCVSKTYKSAIVVCFPLLKKVGSRHAKGDQ